jgi:hypothetical protein
MLSERSTRQAFDRREIRALSGVEPLTRRCASSWVASDACPRDGESLPYVVRFSDPPTAHEQLQLAACRIRGHRVAIRDARKQNPGCFK